MKPTPINTWRPRAATYEWSRDGETWTETTATAMRLRVAHRDADALMRGEVEAVQSKDGEIRYRRKPKEE